MDWGTISPIAELIEAIVIIVSLVYVAVQVRQNTLAVTGASAQAQVQACAAVISNVVQSREGADIWYRGLQDIKTLKNEENVWFLAQCNLYFRLIESAYFQQKSNVLEPGLWEGLHGHVRSFLGTKGVRQYIQIRSDNHSTEFLQFLQKEMKTDKGKKIPYPGLKKAPKLKK